MKRRALEQNLRRPLISQRLSVYIDSRQGGKTKGTLQPCEARAKSKTSRQERRDAHFPRNFSDRYPFSQNTAVYVAPHLDIPKFDGASGGLRSYLFPAHRTMPFNWRSSIYTNHEDNGAAIKVVGVSRPQDEKEPIDEEFIAYSA